MIYGEYSSAIDIKTLEVLEGDLPQRALLLVREWTKMHKDELLDIWNSQKFRKIKPLI